MEATTHQIHLHEHEAKCVKKPGTNLISTELLHDVRVFNRNVDSMQMSLQSRPRILEVYFSPTRYVPFSSV